MRKKLTLNPRYTPMVYNPRSRKPEADPKPSKELKQFLLMIEESLGRKVAPGEAKRILGELCRMESDKLKELEGEKDKIYH